MTEPDINPEDTAAMRREGSFREYLRSEMARGKFRAEQAAKKPAPAPPPAGHRPGAWPPGTRPPDPPPPIPDSEIARAVQEYRDWLAADRPKIQTACECEPCRLLGQADEDPWSNQ